MPANTKDSTEVPLPIKLPTTIHIAPPTIPTDKTEAVEAAAATTTILTATALPAMIGTTKVAVEDEEATEEEMVVAMVAEAIALPTTRTITAE